jgi:CO/xanthine dehydrogenase FAD-binding subunit
MITDYYRPQSLDKALELLCAPNTYALGGGTVLTQPSDDSYAVVDLQALGLNKLHKSGDILEIGATVTLQGLLENEYAPGALKSAIKIEAPINLRNMATVAGALATCDGTSPFAIVMQALDANLTILDGGESNIDLGDMLVIRREALQGKLIIKIEIPLSCMLAFESVARSPADKPIICVAFAKWPSGRTKVVLGGWGKLPTLVLDGNGSSGILEAIKNSTQDATDAWGSGEYRSSVAAVLVRRCIENINRPSSLGTKV